MPSERSELTRDDLVHERRGGASWIILNRPDTLNAISPGLIARLDALLGQLEADRELRSIVITARGRAFCAGGDLKAISAMAGAPDDLAAATGAFLESISAVLCRLEQMPVPVIGAINGLAIAGGLEIALCCDIVIAAASAQFADGHAVYGLLPGGGGSVRLPRKIGVNRAKHLMLTGMQVSAARMQDWGLISEVVDDDQLEAAVTRITHELETRSPIGLARMKRMIDDTMAQPLAVALRHEQAMCAAHHHSHDRHEGLAAFMERRRPAFKGQ